MRAGAGTCRVGGGGGRGGGRGGARLLQRQQAADGDPLRSECRLHGAVHPAELGAVRPQRESPGLLVEVDQRRRAVRSRMQQHL